MHRILSTLALGLALTACAGGPPEPPALAYGDHTENSLRYEHGDTTEVSMSVMGQRMDVSQAGVATYGVELGRVPDGVTVTITVQDLAATISQPMGAPIRIDESDIDGSLQFKLGRKGGTLSVTQRPSVTDEASQIVSGLEMAHNFFPGLPGRAAGVGDSWTDTVMFQGEDGPGERSETSVLTYSVVGDTLVDGRTLLHISMSGTSRTEQDLEMGGMAIHQESEVEVEGFVLWDFQRRLMFENYRRATGSGTVTLPIMPAEIPIEVISTKRTRLRGM
jgi:hypothetical protein